MKTKAAIAWQAGAPLTIETVDLAPPQAGDLLGHAFGAKAGQPIANVLVSSLKNHTQPISIDGLLEAGSYG